MENYRKTYSTYNKSKNKSLIHLSKYNRPSSSQDTVTSLPNNKPLFSKHGTFLKTNNAYEVALYHNETTDRHDDNCKILEKGNLQKIMLTHPKQIISRKTNTNQHSEIYKVTSHNIKKLIIHILHIQRKYIIYNISTYPNKILSYIAITYLQ